MINWAGTRRAFAIALLTAKNFISHRNLGSRARVTSFLSLRQPADSQWEIRAYADCMAELAEPIVAESFAAFKNNDGSF
jgi:thymidylate synthase ThyX